MFGAANYIKKHTTGTPIERPSLDGEYNNDIFGRMEVGMANEDLEMNRWTIWYVCGREETSSFTKTSFYFINTNSMHYARRLSTWLRQPENLMVYTERPLLPMDENETAENAAGRLVEDEWRNKQSVIYRKQRMEREVLMEKKRLEVEKLMARLGL